jgi:hypothetical protein
MADSLFPSTITGFTEYMKVAYAKAGANLNVYGIPANKYAVITPLYNAYIAAEAITANPDTATTGARRTRKLAEGVLKKEWRKFSNENIRYNSAVPTADLEVFRIPERDTTRTVAGIPDKIGIVSARTVGSRRMEVEVLDSETGKKKKPRYATGSYIYVAVTEVGQTPQHADDYRKQDFSSNCHHVVTFPYEQLAKQAHIYARYSNAHGKEGPEGPVETIIIA